MLQGFVRAIRYTTRRPTRSPLRTATAILSLIHRYRRETRQSSPRRTRFWLRQRPVWGNGRLVTPDVKRLRVRHMSLKWLTIYETVYRLSKCLAHRLEPRSLGAHSVIAPTSRCCRLRRIGRASQSRAGAAIGVALRAARRLRIRRAAAAAAARPGPEQQQGRGLGRGDQLRRHDGADCFVSFAVLLASSCERYDELKFTPSGEKPRRVNV